MQRPFYLALPSLRPMKYRNHLPHLNGTPMLTDGGLETVLIFQQDVELPLFSDWGKQLGYDQKGLDGVNRRSIEVMQAIQAAHETDHSPMPISGCVGPRGDGYTVSLAMTPEESENYHLPQIRVLADSGADQLSALTLNYVDEAIGIARAAERCKIPVAISFTVETTGFLPDGQDLGDAIARCDAETDGYPCYYMINCAHPTHFSPTLAEGGNWRNRIGGIRANASKMSHAELDDSESLDDGNPLELGHEFEDLLKMAPRLSVFGGCCGTDHRHIEAIARSVAVRC